MFSPKNTIVRLFSRKTTQTAEAVVEAPKAPTADRTAVRKTAPKAKPSTQQYVNVIAATIREITEEIQMLRYIVACIPSMGPATDDYAAFLQDALDWFARDDVSARDKFYGAKRIFDDPDVEEGIRMYRKLIEDADAVLERAAALAIANA